MRESGAGAYRIRELGEAVLEMEIDRADRSMALLADDDLGAAVEFLGAGLPFGEALILLGRFGPVMIIALAVHEHDDIGVLFDRAGFAEIRKLWPFVITLLDLS